MVSKKIRKFKTLQTTSKDNFHIQDLGRDIIIDRGNNATMNEKRSNKIPIQSDEDVWNLDIVFGAGTAIGGIKYALMIVSRCMRYTYTFGIKDIKDTPILLTTKKFVSQFGRKLSRMISDRDFKLIGDIFLTT